MKRRSFLYGCRVVWCGPGPGTQWCVIRNRDNQMLRAGFRNKVKAYAYAREYDVACRIAFLMEFAAAVRKKKRPKRRR